MIKNSTFATINSKFLSNNLSIIKKISNNSKIWSVVKSNAYGHRLENVISYLNKTDGFAVSNIKEAISIRNLKWNGPILILEGFLNLEELNLVINYNITTIIHSEWQINILKKYKYNNNTYINIYLKLNSGMNRLGFNCKDFIKSFNILKNIKFINKITLMTHFLNYDYYSVNKQMKIVNYVYKLINKKIDLCLSNSFNILFNNKINKDWIRPGIILYGLSSYYNKKNENYLNFLKIKPIMSLYSKLISIQKIKKNSYVGYGKDFISKNNMIIGTVYCGFYHGYPSNINIKKKIIPVWINNKKSEIIGRISMNMLSINLTNITNPKIGDLVELWGNNIKLDYLSSLFKLSSYNIISLLSKDIPIKII